MLTDFRKRLRHNAERFRETNSADMEYVRGATVKAVKVSPQTKSSLQLSSYANAALRIETECFGIDVSELGNLFPPEDEDIIRKPGGTAEFKVQKPEGEERCWRPTTGERRRVLVYVVRTKT